MAGKTKTQELGGKLHDSAKMAVGNAPAPSPNPMTNLLIADLALRGGGQLLRHMVERTLLAAKYSPDKARNIVNGRSMTQTLIGTAIARVATRSIPGAIVVGGGLLAKALFDRRQSSKAAKAGQALVNAQADKGAQDT